MPRKRKLPDGMRERNGGYHSDFSSNGKRVRKFLSTDFEAARQILNELRARADKAEFGMLDNDYSLKELREEFLRNCTQTLKPGSVLRYTICLENVLSSLPATKVNHISPEVIRRYRDKRLADRASPRTVNLEVSVLGSMLRWGVSDGKIGSNPLTDLDPLRNDHPKEGRALAHDEVMRLLESSEQPWRDIWYCLLVTGMRRNEMVSLTFRDIDWHNRELIVRTSVSKTHRERRIPIDGGLWEILKKQEAGRNDRRPGKVAAEKINELIALRFSKDHVFVSKVGTPLDHRSRLYYIFMGCCKDAGIETRTFDVEGRVVEHVDIHSLRRTFATNLIASGADPKSVQELLGHRTLEMTMKIYTKIHTQTKRQALGKLSYGGGTIAPDHIIEYPPVSGNPVQNGHQTVTDEDERKAN